MNGRVDSVCEMNEIHSILFAVQCSFGTETRTNKREVLIVWGLNFQRETSQRQPVTAQVRNRWGEISWACSL